MAPHLIVAHGTGHWLIDLLPIAPVMILAAWFAVAALRDRRRKDR